MGNYTVYMHVCPNGKRYIGITQQEPRKRWLNGKGYKHNNYFNNAIIKYGWDNFKHEILYTGLNENDAKLKEIELISLHKSNEHHNGYNISYGGDNGRRGCITSDEHRRKIGAANSGKKLSEWQIEILKQANISRKASEETKSKMRISKIGHSHSEDTKNKIGIANSTPVCQYDKSGKFIKTWISAAEASRELKTSQGNITMVCLGKRKTCCGYVWRYADDDRPLNIEDIAKWQVKIGDRYTWQFAENGGG